MWVVTFVNIFWTHTSFYVGVAWTFVHVSWAWTDFHIGITWTFANVLRTLVNFNRQILLFNRPNLHILILIWFRRENIILRKFTHLPINRLFQHKLFLFILKYLIFIILKHLSCIFIIFKLYNFLLQPKNLILIKSLFP